MSELKLVGHTHKDGKTKFITDFEAWKIDIDNPFVTAKEAWDYKHKEVEEYKVRVLGAASLIKKLKKELEDLHDFTQEQLAINNKLETELFQLKQEANGDTVLEG